MKDIVSVWDRRLEVPRTSRSLCQRGGAGESALAISCHDRRPRSPAFGGIASPAAVLLDETGSAVGVFARHRCSGTHQHLNLATRQYPEQPEAEPFTKAAKPGVALTPLPRDERRAASQTSSLAVARSNRADALKSRHVGPWVRVRPFGCSARLLWLLARLSLGSVNRPASARCGCWG